MRHDLNKLVTISLRQLLTLGHEHMMLTLS